MPFNVTFHNAQLESAKTRLVSMSAHSANPPTTANEVGSTRATMAWGAVSNGSMSDSKSVSVPAGATVASVGFWDGQATPVFQAGGAVGTAETFTNAGTATVSVTVSET